MGGGRRSGGACWRATPRNSRLDSSRTMGGRSPWLRPKEHIGPIDPDAFTLNQFLNRVFARLQIAPVDGGDETGKIHASLRQQMTGWNWYRLPAMQPRM